MLNQDEFSVLCSHSAPSADAMLAMAQAFQQRVDPTDAVAAQTYLPFALAHGAELWLVLEHTEVLARFMLFPRQKKGQWSCGFFLRDNQHPRSLAALAAGLQSCLQGKRHEPEVLILAPMNLNTWLSYRLRTDDHPLAFAWEPRRDPQLQELLLSAGFAAERNYHTVASSGTKEFAEHCAPWIGHCKAQGYQFEDLDPQQLTAADQHSLYQLSTAGFKDNAYYEDLAEPLFQGYLQKLFDQPREYCVLVRSKTGQLVGYLFAFMDKVENYLVFKTMVVSPEHASQGIGRALTGIVAQKSLDHGCTRQISALMSCGNRSEYSIRYGTQLWEHHYTLYAWHGRPENAHGS